VSNLGGKEFRDESLTVLGVLIVAVDDLAVLVDDKLGVEVPLDVTFATGLLLKVLPHRVGLRAVDINLLHHLALELVLGLDETADLPGVPRFLSTKLVAREAQDLEPLAVQAIVHVGKLLVVTVGVPTRGSHVGHENDLPVEPREIDGGPCENIM